MAIQTPLRFVDFNSLRSHLNTLESSDRLRTTGKWTTGQIFYHLAAAIEASDVARAPANSSRMLRLLKWPVRHAVLRYGLPKNRAIPKEVEDVVTPPPDADHAQQLLRLRQALQNFERLIHPLPVHPVLGELTHAEWMQFHLRHAELHLGHVRST